MSEAFNENEKAAHDARAWSLATLITALGQFKKRPNPAKLFDELSGRKVRRDTTSSGSEKIRQIMQDSSARIKERELNGG